MRGLLATAALVSAVASAATCTRNTDPFPDPVVDGDLDVDADADAEADADGEAADAEREGDATEPDTEPPIGLEGPGPMTFVTNTVLLTTERSCDLDGDGDLDNVFADLGNPAAGLAVMALNSSMLGEFEARRLLVHLPWVDDRAGPDDGSAVLIWIDGLDGDDPPDPTDDLLGWEGFHASADDLDGCGEPTYVYRDVRLEAGELSGDGGTGTTPLEELLPMRGVRLSGTVEPGGTGARVLLCGYATPFELGETPGLAEAGDLNMLEIFLAGGAAFGIPLIPGLTPDVDLDGLGLERYVTDEVGHVLECIDDDRSRIPGRECWRDPRIVDAFSINIVVDAVPALFLGREPGWELEVAGPCPEPPAESLFEAR